jgi:hypothetical protein
VATGLTSFNQVLNVTLPVTVSTGTVPLRARLTSTQTPGLGNTFPGTTSGEVEDHLLTISPPNSDFGDYTGFGMARQVADAAIRLGTLSTDAEVSNPSDLTATGDDTLDGDDEDLTIPSFTIGTATTMSVPVTITPASLLGGTARLLAFVDWNGDGDVADIGEVSSTQTFAVSGIRDITLTPPVGDTPWREVLADSND